MSISSHRSNTGRPGVNLLAYLNSDKGLGQISRGYRDALKHLNLPMQQCDFSSLIEGTLSPQANLGYSLIHPINLIVMNPQEIDLVTQQLGKASLTDAYNIGSWWWEMGGAPPSSWMQTAAQFDEVWVGSRFIERTFSEHLPVRVRMIPPVIDSRPAASVQRRTFGLDDEDFLFLFMCDFHSVPERKNPLGLLKAFREAFSPADKARLVLKASNVKSHFDYWSKVEQLATEANVTIIDSSLTREYVDSLISLCDCYVSLHRSEGFGLTLAEAMRAGKPVIATGWSGNEDFMDESNSFLVPYTLTKLDRDYPPYVKGHVWAEPDTHAAAALLRQVYQDRDVAWTRAARGLETIKSKYSVEASAQSIREALCELAPAASYVQRRNLSSIASSPGKGSSEPAITIQTGTSYSARVSVCLPVMNGETYLALAIESILNQTFRDFELLISDDCSDDSSLEIIKQYAERDSRIRYWRNEHRLGLFANYNQCMTRATGEFIKLFAQDDILDPGVLECGVRALEKHPSVSLFSCERVCINDVGEEYIPDNFAALLNIEIPTRKVLPGQFVIDRCLFPVVNRVGEPSTVMIPRRFIDEKFDESFHHIGDLEYWIRLLRRGTFYTSDEAVCRFRRHGASTTTRNVKSLLFATDTIRMGRKHEQLLVLMGRTWQEFVDDAISSIAGQVNMMTELDLCSGAAVLRDCSTPVDAQVFQELAFYALRRAGGYGSVPHSATWEWRNAQLAERIKVLEEEVRRLLGSASWKSTKPLRELKRLLGSGMSEVVEGFDCKANTNTDLEEYLFDLLALRAAILKSGSWNLTKPMRMLGLM